MEPLGSEYDQAQERRHGLWGLAVLVMIALVVVSFIIIFTGGGSSKNGNNGATSNYGSGAFSDSASSSHHTQSSHPASSGSSAASSAPAGCADASCTADVAALADAINALRQQHGLAPVTASQSPNAQACAAAHGAGPTCVPHYIFARVATTDGAKAAQALAGVNESWLLAKDATRIEVGFAPQAGGGYDCAVLRFP